VIEGADQLIAGKSDHASGLLTPGFPNLHEDSIFELDQRHI